MDARAQLTLKRTLGNLQRIGSIGMAKADLLDLAELSAGGIMTTADKDALWEELTGRKYIVGHWEPVLRVERWALTERGATALGAL